MITVIYSGAIDMTGKAMASDSPPLISGNIVLEKGAIVRGDIHSPSIALLFSGGDHADGAFKIRNTLLKTRIKASFFFTGDFYRNPQNRSVIKQLVQDGHYLGPHSDKHLLYCSWDNRDSLLVSKELFTRDLLDNYQAMEPFGITRDHSIYFLPPYEWYNEQIARWTMELGLILINHTSGTLSHADYTLPTMENYRTSAEIFESILEYEQSTHSGLNGFFLLSHIGTHPDRTDKFYNKLDSLIRYLQEKGYEFKTVGEMITR